jgi:hypothetical protein
MQQSVSVKFFFETGAHHYSSHGLELTIFLPQTPKCWDYRCDHHTRLVSKVLLGHQLVNPDLGLQLHHAPS